MKKLRYATFIYIASLLAACSEPASENSSSAVSIENEPSASTPQISYDTSNTIRDVMNSLVDVNADVLWNSVGYENSLENGEVISQPETDKQWLELRHSAVVIMEGANALMIPGRIVAPPGSTTPYPDYELTPNEVNEKLEQDPLSWQGFAQGLLNAASQAKTAIDARDVDALMQAGNVLDAACESCHSQYWYREE